MGGLSCDCRLSDGIDYIWVHSDDDGNNSDSVGNGDIDNVDVDNVSIGDVDISEVLVLVHDVDVVLLIALW